MVFFHSRTGHVSLQDCEVPHASQGLGLCEFPVGRGGAAHPIAGKGRLYNLDRQPLTEPAKRRSLKNRALFPVAEIQGP